jgi:predicted amino acid dehydrogenase
MAGKFRIAHLNFLLGPSVGGVYDFEAEGKRFEVQRFGADGSVRAFRALGETLRSQVDAFAFSGLPPVGKLGGRSYFHADYLEVMGLPSSVPVCDGYRARELFVLSGLSARIASGELDPAGGFYFPLSLSHPDVIRLLLENYTDRLYFGDAASILGLPLVLRPQHRLAGLAAPFVAPLGASLLAFRDSRKMVPGPVNPRATRAQARTLARAAEARYVFGDAGLLARLGDQLALLRGKELVVPVLDPATRSVLESCGPARIWDLFPDSFRYAPQVDHSLVDCVHRLLEGRFAPLSFEAWETLLAARETVSPEVRRQLLGAPVSARASVQRELVSGVNSLRRVARGRRSPVAPDFAFIVHPLSVSDIFRVPGAKLVARAAGGGLGQRWMPYLEPQVEKLAARAPGFVLGKIERVVSAKNGREVSGIIYALLSTPRMLLEEDPATTYRRIEAICRDANDRGARILGLGAYTKVVGDAGLTIHRNSPIPVTTGNSLSASATLWAVYDVSLRLGLLPRLDDGKRIDGTALVIGATGSIGRVSAKLLSRAFPRLRLVAPRLERLEELAAEIRKLAHASGTLCDVRVSTRASDFAAEADVLITATSAFDQKVVDVDLLKPGCVVCDCSRPLDFTLEDAIRRPDVLIIESGEVELPGPVLLGCDLGLPGKTVYACLAETAVLAMEGLHEPFSVGRDLDWQKVKRIYKLARAHGVTLSAIRGHAGVVTDQEIALTRDLALRRRATRP